MSKLSKPTQKDWDKIEALYLKGEKPRFIAEKFSHLQITAKQISTKFSKKNLGAKKKKIEEKVQEKLEEKIIDEKVDYNKKHLQLFDDGTDVINGLLELYIQNKKSKKLRKSDAFALEKLLTCIEKIQKGQRLSLGLDDKSNSNVEMPEINIIENLGDI